MRPGFATRFATYFLIAAVFALPDVRAARAAEGGGAIHWSGDKTLYDTRNNRMDLIGHAAIHQNGESLFADKISFERDTKLVHAVGNAVYVGKTALLQGSEMHFNLETRTGTIIGGRVSTDEFTLSGERINKLGAGRFQAHRAEYSTCKDCPQSWTLSAGDVDLELEGYAYLSNVTAKVMDAPGFWIPYLIVPIKTKRQSGLLMPQFGFTGEGFRYVQPFFWAISRSLDATIGYGNYGGRGRRLELQSRYALAHGGGEADFFHLDDRKFRDYLLNQNFTNNPESYSTSRWALHVEQTQELPWDIQEKLRIVDVGDSLYLTKVGQDVPGNGEAYLFSDLSLSHATDKVSAFVFARRYRNILTPLTEDPRSFDPKTVQVLPQAEITSNDKVFFDGKIVGGLSLGATNFVRSAGFFDRDPIGAAPTPPTSGSDFRPGFDPIREAVRAEMNPSLYTTIRAADGVSIVPHLNYYQYYYDFDGRVRSLSRGYMRFDTDISMQFERIYDRSSPDVPRIKHLFRPILNYSVIPFRNSPDHPFTNQIAYAQGHGITGYNFDNSDIIPMDSTLNNANYFAPQGNALSYGFKTQVVRKRKAPGGKGAATAYFYDTPIEWSAGQSFNFRELRDRGPSVRNKPLSRFYSLMTANFDRASAYVDYYYIPYQEIDQSTSRHVLSTGGAWTFEKGTSRVLAYERSVGAYYVFNRSAGQTPVQNVLLKATYSLNDFIMPSVSLYYNILGSRWQEANSALTFQSPSECWKLDLAFNQYSCQPERPEDSHWCHEFKFNLSLNLTGSGFGSVSDPKALAGSGNPQ
ncbi:MAG: LPS-assembly protein LptD [Bdellovibrionales bacterium]|nr:LPS-assembly protein LptD [Bdellovibrionales bacterium]